MSTKIQAKANLIWEVATKLVGVYKPHEYGKVILPMTVLKRFDDILKPTKKKVLEKYEEVKKFEVKEMFLTEASGYSFYNTSKYDFEKLLSDPDNIESNFKNYLSGFSDNVQDILSNFKFENEVKTMADNRLLYVVIEEFNTKKLLDGSGTALWSSTEKYLGAVVKGPEVAEGNYKVDTSVQPGQNNVYKSQIMQVKDGVLVAEVTNTDPDASVTSVREPNNIPVTNSAGMSITVKGTTDTIDDASNGTHTLSAMQTYHGAEGSQSNWRVSSATYTNNTNTMSGYYEVEIVNTINGTVTGGFTYRYRYMDSKTGEMSAWVEGTAAANATATITLNIGENAGATMELKLPGAGSTIQPGDKIVSVFDANSAAFNGAASGSGSLQIDDGPVLTFSAAGSLVKADNGDEKIDYNEIKYHMATMDPKTGVVDYGSLTVEFREGTPGATTPTAGVLNSGVTTVNVRDDGPATKDTKLSDLTQFTNADGVNILANTQELTIYNQGKSTTIYLEQDDTIEDFDKKLEAYRDFGRKEAD